jgi:hypothetical protein
MKLRSFFTDPTIGDLLYGIVNHCASFVGVSYLTEKEADKMVTESIIPIDQVINSFYPKVPLKKGRREEVKVRKPNPIRASPLFTKDEMDLLIKFTSPIFGELGIISHDYTNSVLTIGFSEVKTQIRDNINARWETLQRFANVTKLRLQDIRKISKESTLRKAGVKPLHVQTLLIQELNPAARLVKELRQILGRHDIISLYAQNYKEKPRSVSEAWQLIYKSAFDIFTKMQLANQDKHKPKDGTIQADALSNDFMKAIEAYQKVTRKAGELRLHLNNIAHVKYFKLFGRFRVAEDLINSSIIDITQLLGMNKNAVDDAVRVVYNNLYRTSAEFVTELTLSLRNSIEKALNGLTLRRYENESPSQSLVIDAFIKKLQDMHDRAFKRLTRKSE